MTEPAPPGPGPCPTDARWLGLLEDEPPPSEREELESHLEVCEPCRDRLSALAGEAPGLHDPADEVGAATLARLAWSDRDRGRGREAGPSGHAPEVPGITGLAEIGRGGTGVVFRGRQESLRRDVAVKVVGGDLPASASGSGRARMLREVQALAKIRHPNVVTVFETGEVGGCLYLVMELVEGGTLSDRIRGGVLPFHEAAEIVRDLALAVAEAHARGVVHRDLKPSNVLMGRGARGDGPAVPKLADFGLACEDGDDRLTLTGQVVGTPSYMAPEQSGLCPELGKVGPAVDVHGLGGILQAVLTGRPPYPGETTWEALALASRGAPASLRAGRPDVPRDLESVVAKCLSHEPARRYRSANDLADDLTRFLEGRPVSARPVSAPARLAKWARRRPALATASALMVLLTLAAAAGSTYHVVQLGRAFERLQGEQQKTRAALDAVRGARERERRAMETLTDDFIQRMVQRGPALNEADLAFLLKVRGYSEEPPAAGEVETVESLRFRTSGLYRLAHFLKGIGRTQEAHDSFRAGAELNGRALKLDPGNLRLSRNGVHLRYGQMMTLSELRRPTDALEVCQEVVASSRDLARRDPSQRRTLVTMLNEAALLNFEAGRVPECFRASDEAGALAGRLVAEEPGSDEVHVQRLFVDRQRLHFLGRLGRNEEGERRSPGVVAAAHERRLKRPDRTDFYDWEHDLLEDLALFQVKAGHAAEALETQRRQAEVGLARAARFPGQEKSLFNRINPTLMLYRVLKALHREAEAEAPCSGPWRRVKRC
ncbi:MAG: protein kinase [Isosphaeraceae bacterium]